MLGFDFRPVRRPLHPGANYPHGSGDLVRLNPRTLRPTSRRLAIRGFLFGYDRAADGRRLAVGVGERGRIDVVDVARMRRLRRIRLPVSQPIFYIRWVGATRLAVITDHADPVAWELDTQTGRSVARHELTGRVMAVQPFLGGLAALLAPEKGTGPAHLAVIRAGAAPRRTRLAGLDAGYPRRPDGHGAVPDDAAPDLVPGLAVGDGAAWVVDPQAFRIARVDLASGEATLRDVVTARTSKGGPYRWRHAVWLGDGLLAVSGTDGGERQVPFGLRVVDTRTWTARVLDKSASTSDLRAAPGLILYPRGSDWRRASLIGYEADGRRRLTFRPRLGLSHFKTAGDLAYVYNAPRVRSRRRIHVVDLRTGRVLASVSRPSGPRDRPLQNRDLLLLADRWSTG